MSLSSSMSAAVSGLTASSRAAELVASNVANAMTEGYVKRDLDLSPRELGGQGQGVKIARIVRDVDVGLLNDRRVASAQSADRDARADFLIMLEEAVGEPEDPGSLSDRIASFDAALIEAASRPESDARLAEVLSSAKQMIMRIKTASDSVQTARATADDAIETQVNTLNASLSRIQQLNVEIRANDAANNDASALMDLRQIEVDKISKIVPIRQVERDYGQVALYTANGAVLLDGRAASIGFTGVGVITPDMTQDSGALSGLTLNGQPIGTGPSGLLAGGTLGANFAIRDDMAVEAQTRLDGVARDLVERFADPAVDPTLAPGDAGLFTDLGAAFDPLNEVGLAQRLKINVAADPSQGGEIWRLRDGMNAPTKGFSGETAMLTAMQVALTTTRLPVSGGFSGSAVTFAALNADMISLTATARLSAEAESSFAVARADSLSEREKEQGVDTDSEMQKLLLIEQAYAANARVITTVEAMLDALMSI